MLDLLLGEAYQVHADLVQRAELALDLTGGLHSPLHGFGGLAEMDIGQHIVLQERLFEVVVDTVRLRL